MWHKGQQACESSLASVQHMGGGKGKRLLEIPASALAFLEVPCPSTAQGNHQPCPGCGVGKPHPVGQGSLNAAGTRAVAQRGRKAFRGPSSPTAGVCCLWWGWPIRPETRRGRRGVTGRRMRMARRRTELQGQGTWWLGKGSSVAQDPPPLLRGSRSWLGDGFLAARGIVCVISSRFINCSNAASTARFLARTASSGPTSPRTQRWKPTGNSASNPQFPHPSRAPQIHPVAKPGQAFERALRGTAEPKLLGYR